MQVLRHQREVMLQRRGCNEQIGVANQLAVGAQFTSDESEALHAVFRERQDCGGAEEVPKYLLVRGDESRGWPAGAMICGSR
jgi:hypothetical protein